MSTRGLTVVRALGPLLSPRQETKPLDSACGRFGPITIAIATATTASSAPARSSALVPRCTSVVTQPAFDCCRVTRCTSRKAKAAMTNKPASGTCERFAANIDENTNTVPAGTTDSNGTHTRNAAQSATNADHHNDKPAASRNGVVTGVGACTDWKSVHTRPRSARAACNVSPVGSPASVVSG